MLRLLQIPFSEYLKLGESRVLRPILWNRWLKKRIARLDDDAFMKLCGFNGTPGDFVNHVHEQVRLRFFFHPRNQKDFFLNLLTKTQSEESILAEAQDVLENKFDTLGSGKVYLGEKIDWQKDFKSGKTWALKSPSQLDFMDLKNPTDVKVPWELSRFHQVWWLGKAYWLTRDERYAQKFAGLVEGWIDGNPTGLGVNWAVAMEVAFRAMNWIAGYYFFCESKSISHQFWMKFFKHLYIHGIFIWYHLEFSWRNGNHFLSDVVGLIALGVFFRNTEFGRHWLSWGTVNLEREMQMQVCADGVDYEKSTSYQRLVVELFYTATILCNKNSVQLSPAFMKRLENMLEFILHYVRPDGSIPLFGDADDGRLFRFIVDEDINDHRHALSVGALLFGRPDFKNAAGKFHQDSLWLYGGEGFEKHQMLQGETNPPGSRAFPDGGFYIMRGERVHVMIDTGEIGMGGMGGHGHNDTLSFEYWIKGDPLVVDSGTYAYTFDVAARQELRSTKSHNTVVVDGKEIATFVGLWMIMNDATKPRVFQWTTSSTKDVLEAAHYAYATLPFPVVHRRHMELDKSSGRLDITDYLQGSGNHSIESYLHFAPHISLDLAGAQEVIATGQHGCYRITASVGEFSVAETWFSRSYGVRQKKQTLVLNVTGALPLEINMVISS